MVFSDLTSIRRQGGQLAGLVSTGDSPCGTAIRDVLEGTSTGATMNSYSKWDRDAYIERVGGPEEAERRRKALLARVDGYQLAEIRRQRGLTQADVATTMGVTKGRVSQIERGEIFTVEVVSRYVEALGGELRLLADFGDHTYTVNGEQLRAS